MSVIRIVLLVIWLAVVTAYAVYVATLWLSWERGNRRSVR